MGHFWLRVSEVSWPPSRPGPLVSGVADEGSIRVDDVLELRRADGTRRLVVLRGIEAASRASTGDGLVLRLLLGDDLNEEDVSPGQVLVALPGDGLAGVREPRRPMPAPGGLGAEVALPEL